MDLDVWVSFIPNHHSDLCKITITLFVLVIPSKLVETSQWVFSKVKNDTNFLICEWVRSKVSWKFMFCLPQTRHCNQPGQRLLPFCVYFLTWLNNMKYGCFSRLFLNYVFYVHELSLLWHKLLTSSATALIISTQRCGGWNPYFVWTPDPKQSDNNSPKTQSVKWKQDRLMILME